MDFSGKTCFITGANSGLGFEIARRFAASGAETIIGCRSKEKGEETKHEIEKEIPAHLKLGKGAG